MFGGLLPPIPNREIGLPGLIDRLPDDLLTLRAVGYCYSRSRVNDKWALLRKNNYANPARFLLPVAPSPERRS